MAKPIFIVRLSRIFKSEHTDLIAEKLKKEIEDYYVVVVESHNYETTFEVLNGEFSGNNNKNIIE